MRDMSGGQVVPQGILLPEEEDEEEEESELARAIRLSQEQEQERQDQMRREEDEVLARVLALSRFLTFSGSPEVWKATVFNSAVAPGVLNYY